MIPKRPFYFLRHGQTDWNLEGRYQGHADTPLNRTGIAQAHAAAECLAEVAIDRIVVSPLIRAVATAAIVAERLGKPIQIERGLMERNFGSFNGLVIREVKALHGLRADQSSRDILPPDADPSRRCQLDERAPARAVALRRAQWRVRCPTPASAWAAFRARVGPRRSLSCQSTRRRMGLASAA
jgi:broad specificity phosphatase PhoE